MGPAVSPVLTVTQAAELAQVQVGTLYDWSSRGKLAGCARRAGRHLRIHRDRFLAFIFSSDS
jgi:excisionase family DNA binding protein